jgi:hypothetical protein
MSRAFSRATGKAQPGGPAAERSAPRDRRRPRGPLAMRRRAVGNQALLHSLDLEAGLEEREGREEVLEPCQCEACAASGGDCSGGEAGDAAESPEAAAVLDRLGPGQAFEGTARSRMESAFGAHFSGVRIHTDDVADGVARDYGAHAFAVGHHIAFGAGKYRPGTPIGDALLAHELAHTIQQRDVPESVAGLSWEGGEESPLEMDANRAALGAMKRLYPGYTQGLKRPVETALPQMKSALRLSSCDCGGGTTNANCGTPVRMRKVTSGAFEGGKTMDDYYPDLAGSGLYAHPGTAGPFDTGTQAGSNVQLIGEIPPGCSPGDYHLEQTVHFATAVFDGTHHAREGQTWDDIAASGRTEAAAPFRQVWGNNVSMADPPSINYSTLTTVDLDRDFVTSLRGPSGRVSVNWSTSIRVRAGAVTVNTVT